MEVELLAPAGSFESLKAAIAAGADAIYMGGAKFGARAHAKNLSNEELLEAIDYAHLFHKKIYLAVNTLLKNKELEQELYQYLYPLYIQGLDGVIVQDLGVIHFVKKHFAYLPIHASTQMTITGVESAKLLESLGATRVVTARELSLEEINEIHKATNIEIESFVHGALCYCYSGQCLFSSMLGGRSGNRGRCAQPCRLPYEVHQGKTKLSTKDTAYPLSPKDMCTIELLPEIIKAGVYSLKIEGRMKKPEYTAGVVEIYRRNIDEYLKNSENYKVKEDDLKQLYDIYNRDGFNKGYYKTRNGKNMLAIENKKEKSRISKERSLRNEVLFEKLRQKYIEREDKLQVSGILYMEAGREATFTLTFGEYQVTVSGEVVLEALNQPLKEEQLQKKLKQMGNTLFEMEQCDIYLVGNVFLPIGKINQLRREALDELRKEMLKTYRRAPLEEVSTSKPGKNYYHNNPFQMRALVENLTQFQTLLDEAYIEGIYVDTKVLEESSLKKIVQAARRGKKEIFLALPRMVRYDNLQDLEKICDEGKKYEVDGFLVRNLESYGILKEQQLQHKVIIDHNIYSYNNQAIEFWREQGISRNTIPLELNAKELAHRENKDSEMIIYGYCVMMVTAQCIKKSLSGCDKKNQILRMKDRYQKEFLVSCNCKNCYNTIYNSIPYGLCHEVDEVRHLGIQSIRLDFSNESKEEVKTIVKLFTKAYVEGTPVKGNLEFTKGHFKRGVE